LIPVGPEPAAAAVALVEPWACVEAAYAWGERQTLKPGGKLLVVVSGGRTAAGLETLLAQATPESVTAVGELTLSHPVRTLASIAALAGERFDDIVYFGADADTIEQLELLLGPGAVLDIVLGGEQVARPVFMDVGRVHYDLIRYVGTPGDDASVGYGYIPPSAEIRKGEHAAIIGAAGPMGLMHVIRTLVSGVPGIEVEAVDVDDARLSHLEATVAPVAAKHGVPIGFANSKRETLPGGYSYVAVMVPVAPLLVAAIGMAGPGAIVNAFAGFPIGTKAEVELNSLLEQQIYLVGTSGSRIRDMRAMLAKVEAGVVDTNVSLDAVTGLEGVPDALNAVLNRTLTGKIMVYPTLDLGLTRIADLGERFPEVAAAFPSGLWNRAAEEKLLQLGARNG
jgi:hypothetical protein